MVFINRETHIAKRLGRGASHAGQKHRDAVQLDGQHIVCVFGCLAVFAHNTVVYAWADVFQVFIIGANGTAGDRSNVLDQRFGLWLGIITQVFDVNDTKFGELHLDALLAFAANEELSGLANHAIHREFVVTRPTQGIPGQFDGTATVIQTGLVNRDALVTERLIDLDGLLKRLARFAVGNQYLAFETAGHAGRVVIHQEAVKTNRERQGLNQYAIARADQGMAALIAFRDQQMRFKAGVGHGQTPGFRHLGDQHVLDNRCFAVHPHLHAHGKFAVEQAADANDHNGGVREDVAQPVGPAFLGGQQQLIAIVAYLEAVTHRAQQFLHLVARLLERCAYLTFYTVGEGAQAAATHILTKRAGVAHKFGRIANKTNGGRHHQEAHNQQKPPAVIDIPDREDIEELEPEW